MKKHIFIHVHYAYIVNRGDYPYNASIYVYMYEYIMNAN